VIQRTKNCFLLTSVPLAVLFRVAPKEDSGVISHPLRRGEVGCSVHFGCQNSIGERVPMNTGLQDGVRGAMLHDLELFTRLS
jgi:hypothetical protein